MLYLTFICQAETVLDESISFGDAKKLFLISKVIVKKFGRPCFVYASIEDAGIQSAKIVGLVCASHGVHATQALSVKTKKREVQALVHNLVQETKDKKESHVVLVVPFSVCTMLLHKNLAIGSSLTLIAEKSVNNLEDFDSSWSPFEGKEDLQTDAYWADMLFNTPLSADEEMLIKKTLKEERIV